MKSTRKYLKLFVAALLMLSFGSCNDMLDETALVDLTDDAMWKTPEDFAMASNKLYEMLPKIMNTTTGSSSDLKSINYSDGIMTRDLDADMVSNWTSSTVISSSSVTDEDSYNRNLYRSYYSRVRKVNFVLEHAREYADQDAIAQYVGECYFFRAFASYLYFRDFGPAIIVERVLDTDSPELYGTQAGRLEFFEWIMADLERATSLLYATEELSTENIGRITKEAVYALRARLYLFEGTWQKYHYNNIARNSEGKTYFTLAADYAAMLIDCPAFELFRNEQMGNESYRWMFILESSTQCNPYNVLKSANKEYILRNRFDENIRRSNNNITHSAQGYYASRKMVETYLDINGLPIDHANSLFQGYSDWDSFQRNRDPRLAQSIGHVGQQVWSYGSNGRVNWTGDSIDMMNQQFVQATKMSFQNLKWMTERDMAPTEDGFDAPIIRLAEMMLTYAEAKFEDNGSITDAELDYSLNKVRARVGMPRLTNTFVTENGLDMLEEIRRERTVELYMEGQRLDDLRRWKTAETEMSGNIEGLPYNYKGTPTIYGATRSHKFELADDNGDVYTNARGTALVSFTYKSSSYATQETYPDGSSYVVFQDGSERTFGEHNYYRPIPREERDLNPNLQKTPGW